MRHLVLVGLLAAVLGGCGPKYRVDVPCDVRNVVIADLGEVAAECRRKGLPGGPRPRAFCDPAEREIWVTAEPSIAYFEASIGRQTLFLLGCKRLPDGEPDVSSLGIPKGMPKGAAPARSRRPRGDDKYHSETRPALAMVVFADVDAVAQAYYDKGGGYDRKPRAFYDPYAREIWVSDQADLTYFAGMLGHEMLHAMGCEHSEGGDWDLTPLGVPPIIQRSFMGIRPRLLE